MLIWMALIFFLSHQDKDESTRTAAWALKILAWLQLTPEMLVRYHVPLLVRKLAHFTEYFVLYLLVFRVMRQYKESHQALVYSWLVCVAYAATDEFHQTFIFGRVGQVMDVGIDSLGALFALGITRWKERRLLPFRKK